MEAAHYWGVIGALATSVAALAKLVKDGYEKRIGDKEAAIAKRDDRIATLEAEARATILEKNEEIKAWREFARSQSPPSGRVP